MVTRMRRYSRSCFWHVRYQSLSILLSFFHTVRLLIYRSQYESLQCYYMGSSLDASRSTREMHLYFEAYERRYVGNDIRADMGTPDLVEA